MTVMPNQPTNKESKSWNTLKNIVPTLANWAKGLFNKDKVNEVCKDSVKSSWKGERVTNNQGLQRLVLKITNYQENGKVNQEKTIADRYNRVQPVTTKKAYQTSTQTQTQKPWQEETAIDRAMANFRKFINKNKKLITNNQMNLTQIQYPTNFSPAAFFGMTKTLSLKFGPRSGIKVKLIIIGFNPNNSKVEVNLGGQIKQIELKSFFEEYKLLLPDWVKAELSQNTARSNRTPSVVPITCQRTLGLTV